MNEPIWLDRRAVAIIHEEMLALHGGATGVREASLLDSALARPLNAYAYGETDLCNLAALYAAGVVKMQQASSRTTLLLMETSGRASCAPHCFWN